MTPHQHVELTEAATTLRPYMSGGRRYVEIEVEKPSEGDGPKLLGFRDTMVQITAAQGAIRGLLKWEARTIFTVEESA